MCNCHSSTYFCFFSSPLFSPLSSSHFHGSTFPHLRSGPFSFLLFSFLSFFFFSSFIHFPLLYPAARDDGGGELVAPARGPGGLGPIGAGLGADPSSPPSGMKACGCTIPTLKSEADGQIWWPRDGSGTLALGSEAARRSSGLEADPPSLPSGAMLAGGSGSLGRGRRRPWDGSAVLTIRSDNGNGSRCDGCIGLGTTTTDLSVTTAAASGVTTWRL